MTGSGEKVKVQVQWAWQGKAPGDRGYRLLAHSTGAISAGNFEEILGRFVPGTLERLPQVTVSYVPGGPGSAYLSMAFHEEAAGSLDRLGRDVTFTRFFCLPYQQLADGEVSYRALCEAFERFRLPEDPGEPFQVELSCPSATIPGDPARALPVVELLLTGNPVCILGAEATSMTERLAYIDSVMSLLPYGMRAEMAAATWTSSTSPGHKYRLFFSEAPRRAAASGFDDHLVRWQPDTVIPQPTPNTRIPPELGEEYRQSLQYWLDQPSITKELAQDRTARAFRADDIAQILDDVIDKRRRRFLSRGRRRRESPARNDETRVAVVQREPSRPSHQAPPDPIEGLLDVISENLNAPAKGTQNILPYQNGLQDALNRLFPDDKSRARYRARIVVGSLLRDDLPIAKDKKVGFYKVLLRAAFKEPIGYLEYCAVEQMLDGAVPEKALLETIDEIVSDEFQPDRRAAFIVHYHLRKERYQKSKFGPAALLEIAAYPHLRENHARIIWGAAVDAVKNARSAEVEQRILPLLRKRGFLALELQQCIPGDLDFQVNALTGLLAAVYNGRVYRDALPEVLSGAGGRYPTAALLLALFGLTADEDTGELIFNFMCAFGESQNVAPGTRSRLAHLHYARDLDEVYAESGGSPTEGGETLIEGGETLIEGFSSTTDAVQYMNTMRPADPPEEKRGVIRRMLNPSGDFPTWAEKHRADNER